MKTTPHFIRRQLLRFTLGLTLLGFCGCRSAKDPKPATVPSQSLIESVLSQAQDPRKYGMRVFRGEHGPVFEESHRLHANQTVKEEFVTEKKSFAPMILGMVRKSQTRPALIDTLSKHNWIDFHHALLYGTITMGPEPYGIRPTHVLDTTDSYIGLIPTFRIDMLYVENLVVNVRPVNLDLGPLGRGLTDPKPAFVLGQDFLKNFSFIRIDFPIRQIEFATTRPYKPDPFKLLAESPIAYTEKGLTVEGSLDNYEGPIAVDLAGDYEFAIPYPETLLEKQLTVGRFVRRQVPVDNSLDLGFSASSLPSMGNLMFKDLIVTIDNRSKKLFIEKPPLR